MVERRTRPPIVAAVTWGLATTGQNPWDQELALLPTALERLNTGTAR
jgi:hypothetical protein